MTLRTVLETAGALVALSLGTITLCGIIARLVVLPWLRTHLLEPVQEANRQVSVNGHVSEEPTLKDSVHTLQDQFKELRMDIANAAFMFEGHITASERDRANLWAAIARRDAAALEPHDHDPTHRKEGNPE